MDYWLLLFEDVFLTLCIVFTIFYNLFQVWNYFLGVIKMLLFLISTLFVSEIISVFGKSNRDLILFDVNKFLLDLLDQVEKYQHSILLQFMQRKSTIMWCHACIEHHIMRFLSEINGQKIKMCLLWKISNNYI